MKKNWQSECENAILNTMRKYIRNICYLLLVFYAVYAFSPLYAAIAGVKEGEEGRRERTTSYSVGILLLDVVLNELLGVGELGPFQEITFLQPDENIIFLKKKRTINRSRFALEPVVKIEGLSYPWQISDVPTVNNTHYDIARDPLHQHADGYYALSTGLSPPFLLA